MKFSSITVTAALGLIIPGAVIALAASDEVVIPELQLSPVIEFKVPSLPDSVDRDVNKFDKNDLLKNVVPSTSAFWKSQRQDWTTIMPDTSGVYHLTMSEGSDDTDGNVRIQKLHADFRPDAFFSGNIKVSTPCVATLYVNGGKVADKATQDSVPTDFKGKLAIAPYRDTDIELHLLADNALTCSPEAKISIIPDEGSEKVRLLHNPGKLQYDIMSTVSAPRTSSVRVSPDGRYMIVTTSETSDGKNYTYSYDIRDCMSGNITTANIGKSMRWLESKGSTLYFEKDNADGSFDIMTIDYPSMKYAALAHNLPAEAGKYVMSPTGEYIVYETTVESPAPSGVMRRVGNPDDRIPGNRNRTYLNIIRFSEGFSRPLTRGGASTTLADIRSDGKKLLYITTRETPSVYPFYDLSLVQLDLSTLRCDTILGHEPSLMTVTYSPAGNQIFITAGPSFHDGCGAACGEHEIANDFDIQGYLYDIATADVTPMTKEFAPSISGEPVWNAADGQIYFKAQKGFDSLLYTLNPKSGVIRELSVEIDYILNFSIGNREDRYLAYTGMGYEYMGRACLLDLKTGRNRVVADPASELIAAIDFGKSEMWSFTSSDGTRIEGSYTLPPDFDTNKKYPMIVYYYGGTTPSTHTNHSPYSPQLFASYGYVVLVVNPSGTIGYGQEFSARHVNAWGEGTADDIISGTQQFCDEHPYIDRKHIGCIGASYGGFMTQLLTARTDIFAAAVSHAGISNVASYWGEGYWGYSYNAVAAAKSYPWSNPELFTRNSSLFNADKIHTPLLLLHGSVDTNVPIGESIQLFNALKILGREVEFITIDGENHIVMDFEKRKEWHATIMAWFEKWLKVDGRWWNSIYK